MTTIVTRAGKGSPLTNNEVDTNFTNLNDAKIETLTSNNGSIVITGTGSTRNLSITGSTAGGGGASVSYYFNGSVNQGTIGGNTYYEMSRSPIFGAGTDFTIAADGYIAQFITDAADPSLLNIPAGNWNLEMYFSASSGGGSPAFYLELYKYNGTTFTLIASGSTNPEGITGGTSTDLYLTSLGVPQTTLAVTDRLAMRVYVIHSGRTITLHTENSNLCQIITTFSTGLNALNGLTAQVQGFAVGTAGTDFNISSVTDVHTFNLPSASATSRGLLTSANWTSAFASQAANTFYAAPNGGGTPAFRTIAVADVPTLNQNTTGSAATLTNGRTIAITGDLAYTSPSFDGSTNVTAVGTLATVNSNTGSFGSSTAVPVITVNGKGLITAVSTAAVSGSISVTGGDLTLSGNTGTAITNATLATVNSNVGSFGSATDIPVVTVNAKGLVTAVSTASVQGGASLSNDTATATNLYPLFAAATTGTPTTIYTSNAKYLYKPSTGDLQATAMVSSNGLTINSNTVSTSYSIPSGSSAMSAGPMTVASGVSVTVPSGSRWVIL